MSDLSAVPVKLAIQGILLDCTFDFVDLRKVEGLAGEIKKGYKKDIIIKENIVLQKRGDGYKSIDPVAKYLPTIHATGAGRILCAILLDNMPPHTIRTARVLVNETPPLPLMFNLSKAAKALLGNPDAIEWLQSAYQGQLHRNAGFPALIQLVFGKKAIHKDSIGRRRKAKLDVTVSELVSSDTQVREDASVAAEETVIADVTTPIVLSDTPIFIIQESAAIVPNVGIDQAAANDLAYGVKCLDAENRQCLIDAFDRLARELGRHTTQEMLVNASPEDKVAALDRLAERLAVESLMDVSESIYTLYSNKRSGRS